MDLCITPPKTRRTITSLPLEFNHKLSSKDTNFGIRSAPGRVRAWLALNSFFAAPIHWLAYSSGVISCGSANALCMPPRSRGSVTARHRRHSGGAGRARACYAGNDLAAGEIIEQRIALAHSPANLAGAPVCFVCLGDGAGMPGRRRDRSADIMDMQGIEANKIARRLKRRLRRRP
jgi:hypothetical protein